MADDHIRACAWVFFSPPLGFSTRHGISLLNNNYLQQYVTLKTISRHKIVTDLRILICIPYNRCALKVTFGRRKVPTKMNEIHCDRFDSRNG